MFRCFFLNLESQLLIVYRGQWHCFWKWEWKILQSHREVRSGSLWRLFESLGFESVAWITILIVSGSGSGHLLVCWLSTCPWTLKTGLRNGLGYGWKILFPVFMEREVLHTLARLSLEINMPGFFLFLLTKACRFLNSFWREPLPRLYSPFLVSFSLRHFCTLKKKMKFLFFK